MHEKHRFHARMHNKEVGTMDIIRISEDMWQIDRVKIAKEYRGKGIASKLHESALKWVLARGEQLK